jgi:hypothetical protein
MTGIPPNGKKRLLASWEIQPFQPHQLPNTVYYCVELNMSLNPNRVAYYMGTLEESEIKSNCTERGGDGLVCRFPNGESHLFKFYWFLNKLLDIQFWKVGGTTRYVNSSFPINNTLLIHKSLPCTTAQRYLDKTYGDSQYTLSILHAYQQKTSASAHLVNLLKYKESKISSQRIVAQYSLPASDEAFKSFTKKFHDVTRAAVLDIYGKFSEFTTPILSLDQITLLANEFRKQIPHYFEMISTLLNRERYAQHKRAAMLLIRIHQ